MPAMRRENRLHPRLRVFLASEYRVRGESRWHAGTVRDLSAGGATLLTAAKIPVETSLRLRFRLGGDPEADPIEVETLVLRAEAEGAVGGNVQFRAGLHFLDLHGPRFEHVRRYIFERQGQTGETDAPHS